MSENKNETWAMKNVLKPLHNATKMATVNFKKDFREERYEKLENIQESSDENFHQITILESIFWCVDLAPKTLLNLACCSICLPAHMVGYSVNECASKNGDRSYISGCFIEPFVMLTTDAYCNTDAGGYTGIDRIEPEKSFQSPMLYSYRIYDEQLSTPMSNYIKWHTEMSNNTSREVMGFNEQSTLVEKLANIFGCMSCCMFTGVIFPLSAFPLYCLALIEMPIICCNNSEDSEKIQILPSR